MMRKMFFLLPILCLCLSCSGPIYRINSDTDLEPGFQQICWEATGHANYSNPPRCLAPEEIVYARSRIPLIVYSAFQNDLLDQAIANVNSEFDCELLRFDGTARQPDIRVYLSVPLEAHYNMGMTTHTRLLDGTIIATVSTPPVVYDGTMMNILRHEFGHVLGLGHDPFTFSIMYESYIDNGLGLVQHFTVHDRRLVRERYCL